MKHVLIFFSLLAASLGGCAIYPVGYGDHRDGYNQGPGYSSSDHRDRYYDNRRYQSNNGNPFRDHGP